MKKYIATGLVATMALSLLGCAAKTEGKIELGEYKGITAYEKELDTDEAVKTKIEDYCDHYKVDKTRKKGKVDAENTANVTYKGTIKLDDGTEYTLPEGAGSATEATVDVDSDSLTGETSLFAKDIIGKKVGKTFEVKTTFPEDYANTTTDAEGNSIELKGKDVTYSITINSRTETVVPEFNDKFVEKHFGAIANNTKDFETYVAKRIKTEQFMAAVWDDVLEGCKVESYDSDEYDALYDKLDESYRKTLSENFNSDLDTYLEVAEKSMDDYKDRVNEKVEESLKYQMVINRIAKNEGIEVKSDSENYKLLEEQFAQYNTTTVSNLEQSYDAETILSMLNSQLVYDFITDNAVVEKGERPTEAETETETESQFDAQEQDSTEAASEEESK